MVRIGIQLSGIFYQWRRSWRAGANVSENLECMSDAHANIDAANVSACYVHLRYYEAIYLA